MSISVGAAAIIGALIAAIGTGVSSGISSADAEKALSEGRKLAFLRREDELSYKKSQERLDRLRLRQQKNLTESQLKQEKELAGAQLGQRKEEFGFTQRQTQFSNALGLLNSNETMRNNFAGLFQTGRA